MKNEEWQYKFLKTGTEYGFVDLSPMVGVVSEILAEQKKELMEQYEKVLVHELHKLNLDEWTNDILFKLKKHD